MQEMDAQNDDFQILSSFVLNQTDGKATKPACFLSVS